MEPFYFKSYERVVGLAYNARELETEIERIGKQDPACVNWHLQQGHIVSWLKYIGEGTLAEMLKGVADWREAVARIRDYYAIQQRTRRTRRSTSRRKSD